ncbi:MAG: signal peptidase I [Ignavibacteria bacterium]|jgi:signal peptidase I|nr:signal peptidase I [Ignavibacteria bacterium]
MNKKNIKVEKQASKEEKEMNFFQKSLKKYKERKAKRKEKQKQMTFKENVISWTKTIVGALVIVMIINGIAIASFVVPTGSMENTVMTGDFLFVNKFVYGPTTPQVIPFFNIPLPYYKFPGVKKPKRDDVIVFVYPGDRDEIKAKEFQYYLKRCVAIAGDSIYMKDKELYVNNQLVPLAKNGKYLIDHNNQPATFPFGKGFTFDNYGPVRVPKKGDVLSLNNSNFYEWNIIIQREGHSIEKNGNLITIDGKATNSYTIEQDYCFGLGDNRDNSLDSRAWGFIPVENVVGSPIIVYWSWDTNLPFSELFKKFSSVRWSRIGNLIK